MYVIGTAGHVDHGKSSLVERLTGIDPDRLSEEKARGLTIDLGFAWMTLPSGTEVGLVDVPGHERFIKNMLAGAGGISVCLFVVAANEGWMPQSSEHLAIVDILGIGSAVVAVTKADLVESDELDSVRSDIEERVAGTSLEGAELIACSATTGAGLDELRAALDRAIAAAQPPPDLGRPRLWVDRVFTISGAGTIVTGTMAGGVFAVGDGVEVAPEGRKARIRVIQSHKKEVSAIGPGNRTALNLAGLEREGATRGDAIVRSGDFRTTDRIDVQLRAIVVDGQRAAGITEKGAHMMHVGAAEIPIRVRLLGGESVMPGRSGFAQLTLQSPLPLQRGDRFVVRDAGRIMTIGGGVVLDPLPSPARRKDTTRVEMLERLVDASPAEALLVLLDHLGHLERSEVVWRTGASPQEAVSLGDLVVSEAELERLKDKLRADLEAHHKEQPLAGGVDKGSLRNGLKLDQGAFEDLVARVEDVVEEGPLVRLRDHRIALGPEQQAQRDQLIEQIDAGGFTPPLTKELAVDPALLRSLVESGDLVRIRDFHLTAARAAEARSKVRSRIEIEGPMTVAEIRDLLGTTRKYAVPLCEWLDETRATRRQGDLRTLGPIP
jgi:selenocysteine-specific elongation factor